MMRILRHEAGHAIDTAYRLRRRARWREIFGPASLPYPRALPRAARQPPLRAAPGRLVCAEPSHRGFRRDLRRVAEAQFRLAPHLCELAGLGEAARSWTRSWARWPTQTPHWCAAARADRAAAREPAHAGRALPRAAGAPAQLAQRGGRRTCCCACSRARPARRTSARAAQFLRAQPQVAARRRGSAIPASRPIHCTRCCASRSTAPITWICTCGARSAPPVPHARWLLGGLVRILGERERPQLNL